MDYDDIKACLLAREDLEAGNPLTSGEIEGVARRLGGLPFDYRGFLRDFGWAAFGPYEIFGAGSDVPPYLDVVHMNESEWTEAGLPGHLVAVMNDGGGNLSCIDLRGDATTGRCEIVLWDHEMGPKVGPTPQAPTFVAFLGALLCE
jgi:hypothetical protein